jgi:hypothetical protein
LGKKYSRVDAYKNNNSDLNSLECERKLNKIVQNNFTYLIIWGQLKVQGVYNFPQKALILKEKLMDEN